MKELTPEQKQRKAEYAREWRSRNPDKVREHAKRTRIKNKDKVRERQRKWAEENVERQQEYNRQWYLANRARVKDLQLQRIHGISLEEYEILLATQNGVCAICEGEDPKDAMKRGRHFAVDHDHETGKVRGLLCGACNVGIGHLQDSPDVLRKAIAYLERFREDV